MARFVADAEAAMAAAGGAPAAVLPLVAAAMFHLQGLLQVSPDRCRRTWHDCAAIDPRPLPLAGRRCMPNSPGSTGDGGIGWR